ncbi:MAG: hypothetical protein QOJ08_1724 [Ilumatobacteraceae bacterium]
MDHDCAGADRDMVDVIRSVGAHPCFDLGPLVAGDRAVVPDVHVRTVRVANVTRKGDVLVDSLAYGLTVKPAQSMRRAGSKPWLAKSGSGTTACGTKRYFLRVQRVSART